MVFSFLKSMFLLTNISKNCIENCKENMFHQQSVWLGNAAVNAYQTVAQADFGRFSHRTINTHSFTRPYKASALHAPALPTWLVMVTVIF